MIKLVVGLGNPGKEYERTRHNAGFWLVEKYAQANGFALRKDPKFKALVGKTPAGVWFPGLHGRPGCPTIPTASGKPLLRYPSKPT